MKITNRIRTSYFNHCKRWDKNDIQLADTGYGQGQVLMTPLHLALTYAPIVNEGNIPSPHL